MVRYSCFACGPVETADLHRPFCRRCGEPLLAAPAGRPRRKVIREDAQSALERFIDFLPVSAIDPALSLGEGDTPLLRLGRIGPGIGVPGLYAKNEAQNPTGSFKDRGTAVAVQYAVASGFRRIGTVSTGNMAASTAAYGAKAGLETFVLLKEGTPASSLQAAAIYGPCLIMVEGDYGRLYRSSLDIGRTLGIAFINSVDPFRMAGYKVTGYEMFLQLARRAPRFVFVPLSSGGHLLGLMRSFEDLEEAGLLTSPYPIFVGVQAEGCAPLVEAFEAGLPKYQRLDRARTLAHAISNPAPPAGDAVLRMIRKRQGVLISVPDEEMLDAQRELAAGEGLFCQPESAAALAAVKKMAARGAIDDRDEAVIVLTGSGLKAPRALEGLAAPVQRTALSDLESCLRRLIPSEM